MFGGNSNWRGPIWLQMNLLIIESLQEFYTYLGDDFKVECPTRSGQEMTLAEVAIDLSQRLIKIFTRVELAEYDRSRSHCQYKRLRFSKQLIQPNFGVSPHDNRQNQ